MLEMHKIAVMSRSSYTETQIVRTLKESEGRRPVEKGCREYGGMEVPDIRRLQSMEEDNQRLKQMHLDLKLEYVLAEIKLSANIGNFVVLIEHQACRLAFELRGK